MYNELFMIYLIINNINLIILTVVSGTLDLLVIFSFNHCKLLQKVLYVIQKY